MSELPQATIFTIDANTYAAMYAGGVVEVTATASAAGAAVARFGSDPKPTCQTSLSGSSSPTIILASNLCTSQVASRSGDNPQISVLYTHYLKHVANSNLYEVFFQLSTAIGSYTDCGNSLEAAVIAVNGTYIAGDQGESAINYSCGFLSTCIDTVVASSLAVNVSGGESAYSFSVPSYQVNFTGGFPIAQIYTSITGSASATYNYSPSAP